MRIIGYEGGNSIYDVGTNYDFLLFFDCLDYFVVKNHPEQDWSLLSDRLYRRYLRLEELDQAAVLMNQAQQIFSGLSSTEIDWTETLPNDKNLSWLDPNQANLAEIFSKFFDYFTEAKESAISFFECFKIYQPLKIIATNLAAIAIEGDRPLQEYDDLEGKPFWLRY